VAEQPTGCAHGKFGVWHYRLRSTAHSRGNKCQCWSVENCAFKQLTKYTQEPLALRHHSVNAMPKSDR
jgi:hypothetical protein